MVQIALHFPIPSHPVTSLHRREFQEGTPASAGTTMGRMPVPWTYPGGFCLHTQPSTCKAGRVLGGFLWPDLPSLSCGIFLLLLPLGDHGLGHAGGPDSLPSWMDRSGWVSGQCSISNVSSWVGSRGASVSSDVRCRECSRSNVSKGAAFLDP